MNNLIESTKALIHKTLEQCVVNQHGVRFRYEFFSSDRLHVVEVYPDYFYDAETIESLEESLLDDICKIDMTQGLLFVKKGSESYQVTNPEYEMSTKKAVCTELASYAENTFEYKVDSGLAYGDSSHISNFALAA